MKHDDTPTPVRVEDLLRLKRAERPPAQFWQQFEREMRIKQLAAIVEPRPWWAPFIRVSTRLARVQLPVGATAILALTFLTVREYQQPEMDSSLLAPTIATKIDTVPGPGVAVAHAPAVDTGRTLNAPAVAQTTLSKTEAKAVGQNQAVSPSQLAGMVPMLGGATQADSSSFSPAARAIAANLAAMKASAPELVQFVEHASGMNAIFNPPTRTQVVDPLSRMQSPSDSRRTSRLLASALPVAQYGSAGLTERVSSDRINRVLTEDRLYDSISRFGVNGNQVAIKF